MKYPHSCMKSIIFTVDTESDNQWDINNTQGTENARYIPRFQELCEEYGIIPVYLVDYSMSQDPFLISYLNKKVVMQKCEVGCHIHAWDTPPRHGYDESKSGRPYLIEYPEDIIYKKVACITKRLSEVIDGPIESHRAGRWAINDIYFKILNLFGYKVDCSVTPGINWSQQIGYAKGGSDYSKFGCAPYWVQDTQILEVPMTITKMHCFQWNSNDPIINNTKKLIKSLLGRNIWLRPALNDLYDMNSLIEKENKTGNDYIEFMIHSSELMPGGSPYFKNETDIDLLYQTLENIFIEIVDKGYRGSSLIEYRKLIAETKV